MAAGGVEGRRRCRPSPPATGTPSSPEPSRLRARRGRRTRPSGTVKPPNISGHPTRKKPTNPRPKMAKFVLTTWAACLARQKPVSTRANPACMKITRTAPMTTQSRFVWMPRSVTACAGSTSWAPAPSAVRPMTRGDQCGPDEEFASASAPPLAAPGPRTRLQHSASFPGGPGRGPSRPRHSTDERTKRVYHEGVTNVNVTARAPRCRAALLNRF